MSPDRPACRWLLALLSLVAVLAVASVSSPAVVLSGSVVDSQLSTIGTGEVQCVAALVSGPEGL